MVPDPRIHNRSNANGCFRLRACELDPSVFLILPSVFSVAQESHLRLSAFICGSILFFLALLAVRLLSCFSWRFVFVRSASIGVHRRLIRADVRAARIACRLRDTCLFRLEHRLHVAPLASSDLDAVAFGLERCAPVA